MGASLAAGLTSTGAFASGGSAPASGDTLILVFLRGGLDGLSACIPVHESAALAQLRPGLVVPHGAGTGAVQLDGTFALHPGLAPLEAAYREGDLALIHAAGSTDPTRSHFAARRALDLGAASAAPGAQGQADGWVGRSLKRARERSATAPRGIGLGAVLPRSFMGGPRVVPVNNPANFAGYGNAGTAARRRATLAAMHSGGNTLAASAGNVRGLVKDGGSNAVLALDTLGAVEFDRTSVAPYPDSPLGGRLMDAATLVHARVGVEVIHVEAGDWDDHDDMGPNSGSLAARLDDLGRGLGALRQDLGAAMDRTTVVVYSEFGRRVDENGSRGTDHGRGGLAMVLGGHVRGGVVHGHWPGLGTADLDDGALRVTTDLRDVFAEVATRRLGTASALDVFPGHVPAPLGIVT